MLNYQEVAEQMGITRQAVYSTLKRSIPKIYDKYKYKYNTEPYETIINIIQGLNIQTKKDTKMLYSMLSEEQKKEVLEDMTEKTNIL